RACLFALGGVLITWSAIAAQEASPSAPCFQDPLSLPAIQESEGPERRSAFEDPIETDRASFTPSTETVGSGRLVVESSFSFEDNPRAPETYSFPELLLRYGVSERVELRLGWNYEVGDGGTDTSGSEGEAGLQGPRITRDSRTLYGTK